MLCENEAAVIGIQAQGRRFAGCFSLLLILAPVQSLVHSPLHLFTARRASARRPAKWVRRTDAFRPRGSLWRRSRYLTTGKPPTCMIQPFALIKQHIRDVRDNLIKKEPASNTHWAAMQKLRGIYQVAGHNITRSQSHRCSQRILPHGLNTRPEAIGGSSDAMLLWEPMSISFSFETIHIPDRYKYMLPCCVASGLGRYVDEGRVRGGSTGMDLNKKITYVQ